MKIEDIQGRQVKLGPSSITCLDDDGKTVGVVTKAANFLRLQPNRQSDWFKAIRACGIWGANEGGRIYVIDGKAYYLYDLRPIEFYEKHLADKQLEADDRRYRERIEVARRAAEYMTVIPCYILT